MMIYSIDDIKKDVNYSLDSNIRSIIIKVKQVCLSILGDSDILLFGSIAKGKYNVNSDIDILILLKENKTIKELREVRHNLEDKIDELNLGKSVDIKLYGKERYLNLIQTPSFEQIIISDLIDIKEWSNG